MQVDRPPSRWPYVVLLAGLLMACVMTPGYWQSLRRADDGAAAPDAAVSDGNPHLPGVESIGRTAERPATIYWSSSIDPVAAEGLLAGPWLLPMGRPAPSADPTPTIDDLIAVLNPHAPMPWFAGRPASESPLVASAPVFSLRTVLSNGRQSPDLGFTPRTPSPELPGPLAVSVLRHVGTAITIYSAVDVGRWLGRALTDNWQEDEDDADDTTPIEPSIGPAASKSPTANASPTTAWTTPTALIGQLARLAQFDYSRHWAARTIIELEAFTRLSRYNTDATFTQLARLTACTDEALGLAEAAADDRLRVELLRAHWSLARRLDRWSATNDIRIAAISNARVAARGELDSVLSHIADRADVDTLGVDLESYERTRNLQLARQIAEAQLALQSSADPLDRNLADAVEQHYRNANVRFAVTEEMLNRFVRDEKNEWQSVRDRIAGTPVRGQSETLSESRVALEPADGHWRVAIEAEGVVHSRTIADGGQARLRSVGSTNFTATKTVVVDADGVRMAPTFVSANNHNRLVGVTTDFDWVPILSAFAQERAIDAYRAKRPRAKAEIESKVAVRAAARLDERATGAVEQAKREIQDRVTGPLGNSGVELTPIELTTSADRLVARLRVAGQSQLGGHTPRPRALSDSLASLQIHESALTNAAVSLGLDGRRITAPELQAMLREKFPGLASANPPEAREDTVFQFADRDAVTFHIQNGKLAIALSLADFEREGRRVHNFIVHAFYVPVVSGLDADLVRDGALGIEGRLSSGERARLHSVFKEVLSEDRRLPVIRLSDPADPRLAGLMVTQLVLEDGWLGLAVGPESTGRVAQRSRSLR